MISIYWHINILIYIYNYIYMYLTDLTDTNRSWQTVWTLPRRSRNAELELLQAGLEKNPMGFDDWMMWMRKDLTQIQFVDVFVEVCRICGACWTFPFRDGNPNTVGFWNEEIVIHKLLNRHELSQEAKASQTRAKLEDYDPWKIRVPGPVLGAFASLIGEIWFSEIMWNHSKHFQFACGHTATSQQSLPGLATRL